jgi:membrane associated rhomboid family serine protease
MEFGNRKGPAFRRWPGDRVSVVMALIVLNIAVSLLQWVSESFAHDWVTNTFALSREGISQGYYWQLVTYMFLHGGIIHLAVNCLGLYFVGPEVETVCGRRHFLGIYFLGGIFGGLVQLLFGSPVLLMGASAGVCAVVLAFTTMLPELEITALLYFIIPIRMKAKWLGRIVVGSSIFFLLTGTGGNVGHLAHLGGALFGWVYTRRLGFGGPFWFQRFLRDRKRLKQQQEQMDPTEFISREIDPILDKIAREGIHSLTRSERHILEMGREKIAKKTVPPQYH